MKELPEQRIKRLSRSRAEPTRDKQQDHSDKAFSAEDDLPRGAENVIRDDAASQKTQFLSNDHENALPPHYRLIEMLGRGGMAEVFLARDDRLERNVAIKFLNSEFRRDPDRMRRFSQEAKAASALNHPNILVIHDIGENEGVQFIVSEYVEGETLADRIARGRIPLTEAVEIAIQIASALAASHKAGIVHRDMKPDNVMLRSDGTVKVLDFGLAKEVGNNFSTALGLESNTPTRVSTSPGLILGTPRYMSPEQARCLPLDARTDIFSLGIIIFEMVTGRPPFAGESMVDIIAAIVGKEPKRLEEYLVDPPAALIRIVEKALRKDREERYASADHLVSDLQDLKRELVENRYSGRATDGTQVRATTFHDTVRTFAGKIFRWEPLLLLAAIVVLIAAGWWYLGTSRQDTSTRTGGSLRTVPITSWSSGARDLVSAASFSPDGNMVAYSATRSEATEIWVKPTVGGDPVQVTRNGFYNQYPIWSPDGQKIAFFSGRGSDRGIWTASFTGGDQTQLAARLGATARPVLWAKSGTIYYQEGSELFGIGQPSGDRRQVTDFTSDGLKPRAIEISADEATVAYTIRDTDVWRLRIRRLDSVRSLEIATSKEQIENLAWRQDGRAVVYSSSVDGAYQVFEARIDGGEPLQLSNGNLDFLVHDISGDGSKILYGSVTETSDLWSVNTESTEQSLVANDVEAEYWADLSPDGKSIAFQSSKGVDRVFSSSIKILPRPGSPPITVSGDGSSPVWSNSGRWLAFFRRAEGKIAIFRVKPTGDEVTRITDDGVAAPGFMVMPYLKVGVNHIDWSPNDEYLAYPAIKEGISNIWVSAADGSRNVSITGNQDIAESFSSPSWTPEGKFIVFSSEYRSRPGRPENGYRLRLLDVHGGGQRVLYDSGERLRFLGLDAEGKNALLAQKTDPADISFTPESTDVWSISLETGAKSKVNTLRFAYFHNVHLSRDGKTIAFVSRRDDTTALWTVPVNGGTPRRLLVENDPKVLISSLAWAPDGSSIVFGKQTRTNLLSMLAK